MIDREAASPIASFWRRIADAGPAAVDFGTRAARRRRSDGRPEIVLDGRSREELDTV
jgi:hypothetical protein